MNTTLATNGHTTHPPRRRRGRVSAHSPERLLELVADVAEATVHAGAAPAAELVSMPLFNRVKLDVDRARGIADPAENPDRTPTAEAIQMRFAQLAGRAVSWRELLDGAVRTGRARVMWLSALRREDTREDLTDAIVIHALRLVAARTPGQELTVRRYDDTRQALIDAEHAHDGEAGVLSRLLPTSNQILAHCELRWERALALAGLQPPSQRQPGRHRPPPPQRPGMPVAHVIAIYAALNGTWPSSTTLMQFAASCNARMADPGGPMGPHREQAAALLQAEGIEPPTRTRGGGKGKRMTYRYPTAGISGAPPRNRRRDGDDGGGGTEPAATKRRLHTDERRAFAVLSLRVWLASLPANGRQVRKEYVRWQVGTQWTTATTFDRGLGGFSALKGEAAEENARVRRDGGDPLADALACAVDIRGGDDRTAGDSGDGRPPASVRAADPEPVPFAGALRAVLAGETAEAQPPRQ